MVFFDDSTVTENLNITALLVEDSASILPHEFSTTPKVVYNHSDEIVQTPISNRSSVRPDDELQLTTFPEFKDVVEDEHSLPAKYLINTNIVQRDDLAITDDEMEYNDVSNSTLTKNNDDTESFSDTSNFPELSKTEIINLLLYLPTVVAKCNALEEKTVNLENTCSSLQTKCSSLESKCSTLSGDLESARRELQEHKETSGIRFNTAEQYTRSNSLLIHNLQNVPRHLHGHSFTKYVAKQLKFHFPDIKSGYADIDTSHILYFEGPYRQSPVIVCKFVSRDLRNIYFDETRSRHYKGSVYFSDHMTPFNRELFDKAVDLTNIDSVWFAKRKIFAVIDGVTKQIDNESDLVCAGPQQNATAEAPACPDTASDPSTSNANTDVISARDTTRGEKVIQPRPNFPHNRNRTVNRNFNRSRFNNRQKTKRPPYSAYNRNSTQDLPRYSSQQPYRCTNSGVQNS